MQTAPVSFAARAKKALGDAAMRGAMAEVKGKFISARAQAAAEYGDFESLRERGKQIREQSINEMPALLRQFEQNAQAAGARVFWAANAEAARKITVAAARHHNAKLAVKSKSITGEEIRLNGALEKAGIKTVETDLGEFILQLAGEEPFHIIAPAMHKRREEIAKLFAQNNIGEGGEDIAALTRSARKHLRAQFLAADIGITGANFLFADIGAAMIVTNEGNGRLAATLPKVRITIAGIDKIVARFSDSADLLALLTRSATGQKISNYVTVASGARNGDCNDGSEEGPRHHYIILLDNGRSAMRKSEMREMLRCIRCGACMNHCPVYHAVGGHSYGPAYMGPMGQVLIPALRGINYMPDLPHAATMCGACEVVCPVKIPLPGLMRKLREKQVKEKTRPFAESAAVFLWTFVCLRPRLYNFAAAAMAMFLRLAGGGSKVRRLFFLPGWFSARDLICPPGRTLAQMLKKENR